MENTMIRRNPTTGLYENFDTSKKETCEKIIVQNPAPVLKCNKKVVPNEKEK